MSTQRIESLKKETTNIPRKNKRLSKLKIDFTKSTEDCIKKIYGFYGSQIENNENYSLSQLKEIFNFEYFNFHIEFETEEIRERISQSICKDNHHRVLRLVITSIYNPENQFIIHSVLGGKAPKKTETHLYYAIHPKERFKYYRILDFNYILGFFTMLDRSFSYYFERNTYYSYYENSYAFEDAIEILNMNNFHQLGVRRALLNDEKTRIIKNFYKIRQMICDAVIVLTYEDNKLQLMDEYNNQQKSDYAKSYETKKNIPDKILEVMRNNEFLRDFTFVEADESIDIQKFKSIEREYTKLRKVFDFENLFKEKAELRFRRLGKLKALGAYYPGFNCVCIDIKSPSSFMHEIGHLIDYTTDSINLSLKQDFSHIGVQYTNAIKKEIDELDKNSTTQKYMKRKLSYFTTPTEIFARSFEIFLLEKGYSSSFSKAKKSNLTLEGGYPKLSNKLKNDILEYFDSLIKINEINEEEELKKSSTATLLDFKYEQRTKEVHNKTDKPVLDSMVTRKELEKKHIGIQLSLF